VIIIAKHVKNHLVNVQAVMKVIIYLKLIPVCHVKAHAKHVIMKITAILVLMIIFFIYINAINAMSIVNQEWMPVNAKIVMMAIIYLIINV
jgi:hypothetical protein